MKKGRDGFVKPGKKKNFRAKEPEKEFLYGFHPVMEALRGQKRRIEAVYLDQELLSKRKEALVSLCDENGIEHSLKKAPLISKMAGNDKHQGVCAHVSTIPYSTIEAVLKKASEKKNDPFILMLDSILDPQNFGALLRTAYCAGVHGVIIPKDRSTKPTPLVSKASAGALEHTDLICVTNMVSTMNRMKKKSIWICGLDLKGSTSLFQSNFKGPLALVIGGEEKGIRPLVKKACDFLVQIPQKGGLNSMNASAAGAVAMYEVFRQHAQKNHRP